MSKKRNTVRKIEPMMAIGENVRYKVVGSTLFVEVDLTHEIGPSKSGKTTLVAKSGGLDSKFQFAGRQYTIGVNVYKK